MQEKIALLKKKLSLINTYRHALGIMDFDYQTIVPADARDAEAEVIDYFSNQLFMLVSAPEMKLLVTELYEGKSALEDPLDVILVEKLYESQQKIKNITPEMDLKMSNICSRAYSDWLKAKAKADYSLFKTSLGDVIDIHKQAIELREERLPNLYDNFLNDCEKGVLQADLDPFFAELKEGLTALLAKIRASKHVIRTDFMSRPVPIYKQEAFSRYLLELNGYDFNKGVLSTTEHPFTSDVALNDARVTTHYYEDNFISNVYSVIHEGGHAIFMQNEPIEDHEHFINDSITNGMHESVSRFYENVLGRSKSYIKLIYPVFLKTFPEFADVSERELYEAVNEVRPSLIRTEADEVTYGLHIIIRYEMEKAICAGEIKLDEIPEKWNALYRKYLGVEVPSDAEGVLQDVHWTGPFGYFPSYALGNCYNAMYFERMKAEVPVNEWVEAGEFGKIKEWLRANVFAKANRITPKEWLKDITGAALSPRAFLEYLNKKYADIYEF